MVKLDDLVAAVEAVRAGYFEWISMWKSIGMSEALKADASELPQVVAMICYRIDALDIEIMKLQFADPAVAAQIMMSKITGKKAAP